MLAEDVAKMQRFLMHSTWRGVGLNIPKLPNKNTLPVVQRTSHCPSTNAYQRFHMINNYKNY